MESEPKNTKEYISRLHYVLYLRYLLQTYYLQALHLSIATKNFTIYLNMR